MRTSRNLLEKQDYRDMMWYEELNRQYDQHLMNSQQQYKLQADTGQSLTLRPLKPS